MTSGSPSSSTGTPTDALVAGCGLIAGLVEGDERLALTHMVPPPTPDQYPEWITRAAEHFDGEIVIGDDLTTITV